MIKTIDTIILILLLVMTIKGIWRGLKKELISLISYGVALLTALSQIDNGTRFFETTFNFHPILLKHVQNHVTLPPRPFKHKSTVSSWNHSTSSMIPATPHVSPLCQGHFPWRFRVFHCPRTMHGTRSAVSFVNP